MMNGVAKLFIHYDAIKRADEVAGHSKHWGLTFCVGTWSEGGDKMGKVLDGIPRLSEPKFLQMQPSEAIVLGVSLDACSFG